MKYQVDLYCDNTALFRIKDQSVELAANPDRMTRLLNDWFGIDGWRVKEKNRTENLLVHDIELKESEWNTPYT